MVQCFATSWDVHLPKKEKLPWLSPPQVLLAIFSDFSLRGSQAKRIRTTIDWTTPFLKNIGPKKKVHLPLVSWVGIKTTWNHHLDNTTIKPSQPTQPPSTTQPNDRDDICFIKSVHSASSTRELVTYSEVYTSWLLYFFKLRMERVLSQQITVFLETEPTWRLIVFHWAMIVAAYRCNNFYAPCGWKSLANIIRMK